jgi:hypothetical protein
MKLFSKWSSKAKGHKSSNPQITPLQGFSVVTCGTHNDVQPLFGQFKFLFFICQNLIIQEDNELRLYFWNKSRWLIKSNAYKHYLKTHAWNSRNVCLFTDLLLISRYNQYHTLSWKLYMGNTIKKINFPLTTSSSCLCKFMQKI